jgi:adenylate kinase
MSKRVILVTGTPCVGKTTLALQLSKNLNAMYINLTELAGKEHLVLSEDKERQTKVINEQKMRSKLRELLDKTGDSTIIIDGHYAAAVVPKSRVTHVFVLRRNPVELHAFMQKNGFQGLKLWENLASEILDVCLAEAVRRQDKEKVCELDVTGKTVDAIASEVLAVLDNRKKCRVGSIDWLGMLETQGVLDEYLRV